MNKNTLKDYNKIEPFSCIYMDTSFSKELDKITKGYSNKQKFEKWFTGNLYILDQHPIDFISMYPKIFEPIENDIYSMRYKSDKTKNIRILFQITNFDGRICILLNPFLEKENSDYSRAKTIARKRRIK